MKPIALHIGYFVPVNDKKKVNKKKRWSIKSMKIKSRTMTNRSNLQTSRRTDVRSVVRPAIWQPISTSAYYIAYMFVRACVSACVYILCFSIANDYDPQVCCVGVKGMHWAHRCRDAASCCNAELFIQIYNIQGGSPVIQFSTIYICIYSLCKQRMLGSLI